MKHFIPTFLLFLGMTFALSAQVQNVEVTNCNNDSSSIYKVLATGKVLMIASNGVDCSYCANRAGALQTWAANNFSQVQVWGAMTKVYTNTNPTCREVADWIVLNTWAAIFTFIDVQKQWRDLGTPTYYIYNPRDSSLAYKGISLSDAQSKALEIAGTLLSQKEEVKITKLRLNYLENSWSVVNLSPDNYVIEIVDLTGRPVKRITARAENGEINFSTANLNSGIFLVTISNKQGLIDVIKARHI